MPQTSLRRFQLILTRGIRRGFQSLRRERLLKGALASLCAVLVLAHVVLLLLVSANAGIKLLREQTDIRLEILEGAGDGQIQDFVAAVQALPYVQDVVYVTREQAYERASKRDPQLTAFLTKFGVKNPFPETMGVRLKHLADYPALRTFITQPTFASVVDPAFLTSSTSQESQVYRLIDVATTGRLLLLIVAIVVLAVLVLTVAELVRRRAISKREELLVQRFVGAMPMVTLIPFFTEVFVLLISGSVVSVLIIAGGLFLLPMSVPALADGGLFAPWTMATQQALFSSWPVLAVLEFVLLPLVAFFGALLALWPELKAKALPFLS